jgi:hypothetical protein
VEKKKKKKKKKKKESDRTKIKRRDREVGYLEEDGDLKNFFLYTKKGRKRFDWFIFNLRKKVEI